MKDFTNRTKVFSDKQIVERIEKWLQNKNPTAVCPFNYLFIGCDEVCHQVFPKQDGGDFGAVCPCDNYSLPYVIRIARQAVKALL